MTASRPGGLRTTTTSRRSIGSTSFSKLESIPADTEWDPSLRQAMIDRGLAVFEEQVLGDLIRDLPSAAT
ncbi:MAG: DUF2399 domain-containing protein [Actinomycetota bacterium]